MRRSTPNVCLAEQSSLRKSAMSRGLGSVQRRLVTLIENQPGKLWTIESLAGEVYSHKVVTPAQREAVRRALARLDATTQFVKCRSGYRVTGGWHYTMRAQP
jgi:hypothetical protein